MKLKLNPVPICFILLAFLCSAPAPHARAEGQGLLATVNDKPITSFDVEQRMKLFEVLGDTRPRAELRKRALQSVIDDVIKTEEAKKTKAEPSEDLVNKQIERMAKGSGTSVDSLSGKLKSKGVSMNALKRYVAAQMAFNRMLGSKGKTKVEADPAEVDRRYAEVKAQYNKVVNDPRMRPVTVYQIQEIDLPLDGTGSAGDQQIMMSRAIEAQQFIKQYKGCKSARAAAEGIFNVKIGKTFEADGSKLPKALKAALDSAGPGKAIGPGRSKTGLQVIGFCGKRSVTPQKPALPGRDAVANAVLNEALDKQEETYMVELRKKAYIEYKGTSPSQ